MEAELKKLEAALLRGPDPALARAYWRALARAGLVETEEFAPAKPAGGGRALFGLRATLTWPPLPVASPGGPPEEAGEFVLARAVDLDLETLGATFRARATRALDLDGDHPMRYRRAWVDAPEAFDLAGWEYRVEVGVPRFVRDQSGVVTAETARAAAGLRGRLAAGLGAAVAAAEAAAAGAEARGSAADGSEPAG